MWRVVAGAKESEWCMFQNLRFELDECCDGGAQELECGRRIFSAKHDKVRVLKPFHIPVHVYSGTL